MEQEQIPEYFWLVTGKWGMRGKPALLKGQDLNP